MFHHLGYIWRPLWSIRPQMAACTQPHCHLHPRTRGWFYQYLFAIPCCSFPLRHWNGRYLGFGRIHCSWESPSWSPWFGFGRPPTRICRRLFACCMHQPAVGAQDRKDMAKSILDCQRHLNVSRWRESHSAWIGSVYSGQRTGETEDRRRWRGPWDLGQDEGIFTWNKGNVEKTLAIVHIRRASHDRCVWFDPLFPLLLLWFNCPASFLTRQWSVGFNFLSHGSQVSSTPHSFSIHVLRSPYPTFCMWRGLGIPFFSISRSDGLPDEYREASLILRYF